MEKNAAAGQRETKKEWELVWLMHDNERQNFMLNRCVAAENKYTSTPSLAGNTLAGEYNDRFVLILESERILCSRVQPEWYGIFERGFN